MRTYTKITATTQHSRRKNQSVSYLLFVLLLLLPLADGCHHHHLSMLLFGATTTAAAERTINPIHPPPAILRCFNELLLLLYLCVCLCYHVVSSTDEFFCLFFPLFPNKNRKLNWKLEIMAGTESSDERWL
jgi:hypothetical protein